MIIFYDANCPLCTKEMRLLKEADKHNKIALEDINTDDFEQRFNHIKRQDALAFLHGQQDNGEMIYGLDVTFAAWQTVGRHKWLKVLQLVFSQLKGIKCLQNTEQLLPTHCVNQHVE